MVNRSWGRRTLGRETTLLTSNRPGVSFTGLELGQAPPFGDECTLDFITC